MKELIHILPDTEGGVASFVYNLISNIQNHSNYKNTILLLNINSNTPFRRHIPGANIIRVNFGIKNSIYKKCKHLAKFISPDATIISNDGGIELDMVKYLKLKNPVVYIIHGDFNYYYSVIRSKHYIIDSFISVSKYVADKTNSLLKSLGSSNKVTAIHFPLPIIKKTEISFSEPVKIIFIGALIKRKGVHFFPGFIKKLSDKNIDYEFNIIGTGEYNNDIIKISEQNHNVNYFGQKNYNEVISILKQNHILFLPSLSEGLPVTIVEAMKAGLIVITNNINSGIPEVINPKTGFALETGDIDAYVNSILKLRNDPDLFYELSRNAAKFANKHFDPKQQTLKYMDVINKCTYNGSKHYQTTNSELLKSFLPDKLRLFLSKKNQN
jgi:glycosyltransferase involved in cell wall biosynthesis